MRTLSEHFCWCAGWGPIFETWPWLRAGSETEIDFTHRRRGTEMRGYIVGRVQQPQERDDEDHASCRSSSISLGVGSAYTDSGDRRVANTQFTELPGVIAQAPVQNAPAVATAQSERSPDLAAIASDGSELQCCSLRLLSPADPLTRLLMKADGVSEAYLDALVQKIAKQRG
jgi:hypothetical protein